MSPKRSCWNPRILKELKMKGIRHGTAPEAVSSIHSLGFNSSYCAIIATENGEGVDFAVDAGCFVSDTYPKPDSQGHKRMYFCKVLTGEYTVRQSGMRVPSAKPGQQSHIMYDSVVNDISNPMYSPYLMTHSAIQPFLSHSNRNVDI